MFWILKSKIIRNINYFSFQESQRWVSYYCWTLKIFTDNIHPLALFFSDTTWSQGWCISRFSVLLLVVFTALITFWLDMGIQHNNVSSPVILSLILTSSFLRQLILTYLCLSFEEEEYGYKRIYPFIYSFSESQVVLFASIFFLALFFLSSRS